MNIDELKGRFSEALRQIGEDKAEKAVTEILIGIQGRANIMVPVKTSALVNSQFRRITKTQKSITGTVGYGAKYAAAVHEAPGTLKGSGILRDPRRPGWGVYWAPAGEPGFLRKAIQQFEREALESTIRRNMSI